MHELNLVLAAVGGIVLLVGLISDRLKHSYWLSTPILALLFGILLSTNGLGILHPESWGLTQERLLEETARFTLAIGLMGVALRLPKGYVQHHWRSLTVVLGVVMPLMWLISSGLIAFVLGVPWLQALLLGAIITPTDPVVATSIVTGSLADRNIPSRMRHFLSAESGANDGLAYPIVMLPILLLTRSQLAALGEWSIQTVLWEVGAAVVFGILVGYSLGRLLVWAENTGSIERQSFLAYTIALTLLVLGAAKLIDSDAILSVFVAGLAFSETIRGQERSQEENVQEAINRFFSVPIFVLLGLLIPWQQWWAMGWKGILLVILILLFRRLPAVWVTQSWLKPLRNQWEVLFAGWFGPIGVAAIYYANLATRQTGLQNIWAVTSLLICASILAHGLTATPGSQLYGKWYRQPKSSQ